MRASFQNSKSIPLEFTVFNQSWNGTYLVRCFTSDEITSEMRAEGWSYGIAGCQILVAHSKLSAWRAILKRARNRENVRIVNTKM